MHSGYRPRSVRAQSSVIGIVLIIGLTLAAASAVVVFGSATLDDGQQRSQIGQAEQAMTQFDSRTAQVALGDSEVQTIRMGRGQGTYRVDESAGHIKIYHENWNSTNTTDHQEDIYEADLGSIVYENGGTTIAYQGGGVWRSDDGGGSTMVSPPEVHNRAATLTLPIVRVRGSGSASGGQQATVRSLTRGTPIFPDVHGETTPKDQQYGDDSEPYYRNPVSQGNMTVEIESQYCEAWRSFFQSRTEGRVDDCDDGVVTAQIVALGAQGRFDISSGTELSVRGVEELNEFTLLMDQSNRGNSAFNSLDWTMSAQDGDEEFSIHFEKGGGNAHCDSSMEGTVSYSNDSVDYSWTNGTAFQLDGPDCPGGNHPEYLEVNLLNDNIDMNGDSVTFDGTEYNSSKPPSLGLLVEHYIEKFGNVDMTIEEGNNAYIGDTSTGNIEYQGSGQVVTFLHVTENEVEVNFD